MLTDRIGIREIIGFLHRDERPCGYVVAALDRQVRGLDRRIDEMRQLRDQLRQLQSKGGAGAQCRRRVLRRDRARARDARPDLTAEGDPGLDLPFEGRV